MAELPRGTVTLVFTDIEGSTRLLESLGSRYEEVLAAHRRLVREAFSSHGGIEVDTQGDALFYAFPRAQDAVTAAIEAQQVLSSHDFGEGVELRVRMGIHTGEPSLSDEGYVGSDVHLGARISAVAWGDQIVVSSATAALVGGDADEVSLRSLGHHALKDIEASSIRPWPRVSRRTFRRCGRCPLIPPTCRRADPSSSGGRTRSPQWSACCHLRKSRW